LGIRSVREIIIGTKDLPREKPLWEKLLMPLVPAAPGLLQAGTGPAIYLAADSTDRISRIVFVVESLDRAKTFLKDNRMLGTASKKEISINAPETRGLSIILAGK
jgi:hypothetical protein